MSVPLPGGVAQILRSDAFDPDEANKRIGARREQLGREIERLERKLANEQFVAKAPPEVVEAERRRLAEHRAALRDLAG
jgi:valyl-tRNA synthetase